ncbi:MAG: family 43 glycosylhydrolase [Clostridia bacterium]|nr:family 43 glycosylhydrolase [Clostridia bacterium]
MKFCDINIRDPFILPYAGKYYLYGTRAKNTWEKKPLDVIGFDVYISEDMENWSEPKEIFSYYEGFWGDRQYWAPEVHYYKEKFYLFASFTAENVHRGTAILVCDTPDGRFKEHSDKAITPWDWECLDGTFYVENGIPYIVFCHEWTQIKDGTVCALQLTPDLKSAVGEPIELWKASTPSWVSSWSGDGDYVTDGPFMWRVDDELICIWSSFTDGNEYCEAISRSDNGSILGKWTIDEELLFSKDGGHGMLFTDFFGNINFVYHTPNSTPDERPAIKILTKEQLKRR